MALPALVGWEALGIACDVWGPANPPKTSPLVTLLDGLLDRPSRLTLATLNYDLVLEKAVMQRRDTGRTFRYGKADCEADPPAIEVLKLHGSLNWKEAVPSFRPHMPVWGESGWLDFEPPFASGSRIVQPSLLLPTLFKQEININYQTDPRAMHYKKLWEVFAKRLSSATALLTVGCSFPETDRHLRAVVGSAVNAGNLQRVVVCWKEDPSKKEDTPVDRLKKVLSNTDVCEEAGGFDALVKGDAVAVDWLMKRA